MQEKSTRNYLIQSVLALACLTLLTMPAGAQSSDMGLAIAVNPTTISRGGVAGVFSRITNTSSSKIRVTVTFMAVSPCGVETSLGYNRVALNPGQTIQVTTSYPVEPNACTGSHAVSINAKDGGKGSTGSTATAYLAVQ